MMIAAHHVNHEQYEVQKGDYLTKIAKEKLGDAAKWKDLYAWNKKTIGNDPDSIEIGQKLDMHVKAVVSHKKAAEKPKVTAHANNLDGWIRQALDVMHQHGIPGTYQGIYRKVMEESGGNPKAINLTDSNAAAGHPSKGLLQAIDSTFKAYHVDGTSWDIYDPVANIVACCNYAAKAYGSIDNVYGAY
ncbi:transglycosylase SLT domain-containing protein [Streptomyces albulus]|nr:transglycosylase SLT domain-containing protein [Streptomyces noursei]